MENNGIQLNTIEEAIAEIQAGKVVIVVDDENRENVELSTFVIME